MRSAPRLAAVVTAAVVGALVMTGCLDDPYEKQRAERRREAAASPVPGSVAGDETETLPSREPASPPVTVVPAPKPTAEQALRDFAARWANWTWQDVERQQRALAAMATGEMATSLAAQARTAPDVVALRSDKPAIRGTVEAVSLEDAPGEADVRRGLVVVREQAYNDDRPTPGGLSWNVYLAEVRRVAEGWAIAQWEGQP